jgi:hypothetical protein
MSTKAIEDGPARPWGRYVLSDTATIGVRLGSRDLWIRRREGEVQVAHHDRGPGSGDLALWGEGELPAGPAEGADWSRWAPRTAVNEVEVRPVLPDRVVVMQPEWPFRLLGGSEARVYVRVPLWVRVELRVEETWQTLLTIPSVTMSDTWWGDLSTGELAYWLPTTARRSMQPSKFAPHLATCPLHMRNATEAELQVDKLALRVAHLTLFQAEQGIWADEARVLYQGHEEGSQIEMSGQPPDEASAAVLVASPATRAQKGLRARTFDRIRALQPFGGIG